MSRQSRADALAAATEFFGSAITKSADGRQQAFRLAAFLEPLCSNYESLGKLAKSQKKLLRKQQKSLSLAEDGFASLLVPNPGPGSTAAEAHSAHIAAQMANSHHFKDLEAHGQWARLHGLESRPLDPWSFFPEVNGHDRHLPATNGQAQAPPWHPEATP